jgi:hypothetical protein
MKYAAEMGSVAMIYIQSLIQIGSVWLVVFDRHHDSK